MNVNMRQMVEKRIARRFINDAIAAGYTLTVNNGEETPIRNSAECAKILKEMFATDEEYLYVLKDGKAIGWVFFVYGNDGYDVISDYTCNLEPIMQGVTELSNKLCEQFC